MAGESVRAHFQSLCHAGVYGSIYQANVIKAEGWSAKYEGKLAKSERGLEKDVQKDKGSSA